MTFYELVRVVAGWTVVIVPIAYLAIGFVCMTVDIFSKQQDKDGW